jgi:hypothetical protein
MNRRQALVNMDYVNFGLEDVDWINLAQDDALVITV